jgi:hypothetical protein
MLERQAYVETKRNVLEAVGTKLPTELYLMVFKYAFIAQNIPENPGEHEYESSLQLSEDDYRRL